MEEHVIKYTLLILSILISLGVIIFIFQIDLQRNKAAWFEMVQTIQMAFKT